MSKLTVITGSMFAGKSKALIEAGKKEAEVNPEAAVLFIKPNVDSRYSTDEIVTHEGESVRALVMDANTNISLIEYWTMEGADVVLFDEVQFFDTLLTETIAKLLSEGKTVYAAGLDLDYQLEAFETTAELIKMADEVVELTAECADCKGVATVTVRLSDSNNRVELGSKESYKPVCLSCHKQNTEGDTE